MGSNENNLVTLPIIPLANIGTHKNALKRWSHILPCNDVVDFVRDVDFDAFVTTEI